MKRGERSRRASHLWRRGWGLSQSKRQGPAARHGNVLTAPAVDNESLEPAKEFNAALRSCRRCLVYHSSKDPVLRVWYRLGALDKALGDKGPQDPEVIEKQCPEVYVVNCSNVVASHGGYRRTAEVYEHWTRVLSEATLPRFETLKKGK